MAQWEGRYEYCKGPRNVLFNMSYDDMVSAYKGVPVGFPAPDVGSFDAVGLDDNACFDRWSRLGPYFGKDSEHLAVTDSGTQIRHQADFSKVDWGELQNQCLERNSERFEDDAFVDLRPGEDMPEFAGEIDGGGRRRVASRNKSYKPRTAVLIRTWDTYEYQENDLQVIRSLVSELSLQSGGEYQVFLFVNVKDLSIPIHISDEAYDWALSAYVPPEFHSIAVLWSESVCQQWYPLVGEWSVYWQQFMPLQWFAKTHPQFSYFWNWEMDARYIGQHYHFTETLAAFARRQPRKYLWERNSRFYIPATHGSYANFTRDTHAAVRASPYVKSIWGPQPWSHTEQIPPIGPKPPRAEKKDNFEWGVGEEADLITLLPLWDPRETFWSYRDKLFNYPAPPPPRRPSAAAAGAGQEEGEREAEAEEGRAYPHIPRRVFINTLARLSAPLLHAMHLENLAGRSMASELSPGSVALHHGLKAVYAPHPIWTAQTWPPAYMDAVFNADGWGAGSLPHAGNMDSGRGAAYVDGAAGPLQMQRQRGGGAGSGSGPNGEGKLGRWGQERDSVYSPDREHNFGGWSWYFWSDFPKTLYWRWLGWRARFEIVTIRGRLAGEGGGDVVDVQGGREWEGRHGRLCLPGMLLHPVKNVRPPEE